MSAPLQLMVLARKAATAQSLDAALVCAVEQESGWNPWAMRYEPAFFAKYVAALYANYKVTASEAYARGFSWGLMQVMGQVARETGFEGPFLSALCDPEQSLALGCKVLRRNSMLMVGIAPRRCWLGMAGRTRLILRRCLRVGRIICNGYLGRMSSMANTLHNVQLYIIEFRRANCRSQTNRFAEMTAI